MRRLRYICGGEEGSVASGSEAPRGRVEAESPKLDFSGDGGGEDDWEATLGIEVLGEGAPLTIWSSFELSMVSLESHRFRLLPPCDEEHREFASHDHSEPYQQSEVIADWTGPRGCEKGKGTRVCIL